MEYNKINIDNIFFLEKIVGREYVLTNKEELLEYGHDQTEDLTFLPEVIVKPKNTEEVSEIVFYCNQHLIPLTPCGARTGLSGGSLPIKGGIVISMERFNKIIEIDTANLQSTVEPGVINQVFRQQIVLQLQY